MLKVLELFGGIGAPRKALERLEIDFKVVDYVEIDKYVVKSYNAIYNENFEPQDICEWDKDIECDLIMHGSPCQDFSLAGNQASGDFGSGTRSSLMWETVRIITKLRPKYVIWENVKNVLSQKHRHNFDMYLARLEELGYTNHYQVLNAKDYGIPQNRERLFCISILNNDKIFIFPKKQELQLKLKDFLEADVDEKYYNICPSMLNAIKEKKCKLLSENDICSTITTKQERWNNAGFLVVKNNNELRFRYFTERETWRLMGFDDEDFDKAAQVNSKTQLYKQAGNSIVVNVLEAIFKELFRVGD
jgi:DNA (cytosine-5)-methyltransferase 1